MEAIKLTTTSFLQRLFSSAPAPVPGVTKPIPLISFFRYRPRIKGGRSRAAQPTASTSTRSFFPSRPRNRGGRSRAAQPTTSTSNCSFFPSRPRNRGGRSRTPAPTASINNCNWCCSTLCSTEPGLASTSYRILLFICSCNCCPIPPNTSNPFVAKYIASKLPDPARVLEHAGVLFGVTTFFFAITVSSPLCLKLTFWTIYALSLLVIVVCNSLERFTSFYRCCGIGV